MIISQKSQEKEDREEDTGALCVFSYDYKLRSSPCNLRISAALRENQLRASTRIVLISLSRAQVAT
jgi:hypothetical protein